MNSTVFHTPYRKSLTLSLTWLLTGVVFLVAVENVWLDPWLRVQFPELPSLVPEPPSIFWLATFGVMGIVCVVLIVGQVLLMRRPGVSRKSKLIAGASVLAAVFIAVLWFCVTSGILPAPRL